MILGIIQARMLSTRLPGKALMEVGGKPLLFHAVDRARHSKLTDKIVVATTKRKEDDAIAEYCESIGIDVFRGNELDVLDRFYKCAKLFSADIIVRITADDPFKEPAVIDKAVGILISNKNLDYVSNFIKPTYPEGVDIEAFTFSALEKAWKEAKGSADREHVTPYIWNHPNLFSILNFECEEDLSGLRWTLDTEKDLEFAREVYSRLYTPGRIFLIVDILRLLEREPQLKQINEGIERNLGYKKSVSEEKINEENR